MAVLVACEYSQTVTQALRRQGIEAISCDLRDTEGNPEWHIKGDAIEAAYSRHWGGLIAHPDCTYMTIAGAAYYNDPGREELREAAIEFWLKLWDAPIEKKAFENPIPFKSVQDRIGKYTQYVNPYDFGEPVRKRICLWLDKLPPLVPTNPVEVKPNKTYIRKTGPKAGQSYYTYYHQGKSAKERARFFVSVADAMAEQWKPYLTPQTNGASDETL